MLDPTIPFELVEHINKHECVLFVGDIIEETGSLSTQLASALTDAGGLHAACPIPACKSEGKCAQPTVCAVPFTRAAQLYKSRNNQHALVNFVRRQIDQVGPPNPIHHALAALPIRIIITTAYDDRLEMALHLVNRPVFSVVRDEQVPYDNSEQVQLIRLHGTVSQPDSLVLTEDDTADLFARLPTVTTILQAHFASKTLLFVGYGLDDPYFLALYRQVTGPIARSQRLAYAIQWPPNSLAVDRWREKITLIEAEPLPWLTQLIQACHVKEAPPQLNSLPSEPYKFLDYFTRNDAAIFFGRDLEADLLLSTILAHSLTILYGRSGTGKTSLLLARVGPLLEKAGYRLIYARMLGDPTSEVKAAVLGILLDQLTDIDRDRPLMSVLIDILPQTGRLVIILDQFEEFFLRHDEAVRRAFVQELADCLRLAAGGKTLDLRFVFSLRDDYLGSLDELAGVLPQDVFSHRYKLENLTRDKALQAILKPAEAFGLPIQEALREQLIIDLEDQGLESTNLQIVLYRLYRDAIEQGMWFESTKEGQGLTLARYQALGGARAILGGYLDKVLSELPQAEQEQARVILKSMVTSQQTKAAISGQELTRADLIIKVGVTETQVDTLLDYLRQKRIVRKFGDTDRYELSHEVMVEKVWAWLSDEEFRLLDIRDMLRRDLSNYQKFDYLLTQEKLELINSCREVLILNTPELELILRSAFANKDEVVYWFGRALQGGINVADISRHKEVIILPKAPILKNIRIYLNEGFGDDTLRQLCYDYPEFRPVYDQLAQSTGKAEIIDRLIKHVDQTSQTELLLSCLRDLNSSRYEQHQPYYNTTDGPIISPEAFKLFQGHFEELKELTKEEIELFLRSAVIAENDMNYWFERAKAVGVTVSNLWEHNRLPISGDAFKLIHNRQKKIRQLTIYELELLFRSALAANHEVDYWFKRAYKGGVSIVGIWQHDGLIPLKVLNLIYSHHKLLKQLTEDELIFIWRSALDAGHEIDYWFEQVLEKNVTITDIWQYNNLLSEFNTLMNIKNIRTLLTEGFSSEELRNLCFDVPEFRPVYNQLSIASSKNQNIDLILEYTNKISLVDRLLVLVKEWKPAYYERYQPFYNLLIPPKVLKQIYEHREKFKQLTKDELGLLFCSAAVTEYEVTYWFERSIESGVALVDIWRRYSQLIPPNALELIYAHRDKLSKLTRDELKLLFRSAFIFEYEAVYWFERVLEAGVTISDVWQQNELFIQPRNFINFKNIRTLLNEGLTKQELRQFCQSHPEFSHVYNSVDKTMVITYLIEYVYELSQTDKLLTLVKEVKPAQYEYYQPYYKDLFILPKILKQICDHHPELKLLNRDDLTLLLRSALATDCEVTYWYESAIEGGVSIADIWPYKKLNLPFGAPILENISTILIEEFSDERLRQLCYDYPEFRPVYDQLAQNTGKVEIIDRLIKYASQTSQIGKLLTIVKEVKPTQYENYEPYYNNSLIPLKTLKLIYKHRQDLKRLTKPDLELLLRSALTAEYEASYWLECTFEEEGAAMLDTWRRDGQLIPPDALKLIYNIREKIKGLTKEDFELLLNSAFAISPEQEAAYWLEQALEKGIITDNLLLNNLTAANFHARAAAVIALGRLGEQFVEPIIGMLADDYPQVRVAAIQALERIAPNDKWRERLKFECYNPAGKFIIGDDKGEDNEKPAHEVHVAAFYIGKYLVTNADYKRYMDDIGRDFTVPPDKANHPVVDVSWYDARDYATWARMRLLTEAEWEKAASWVAEGSGKTEGKKRQYPWGDEFDKTKCNTSESEIIITTSVGTYSPGGDSSYGVADMVGNVWEWCSSVYKDYPYQADDGREDLTSTADRVQRGGSFNDRALAATCVYRYWNDPSSRYRSDGFRIGWSAPTSSALQIPRRNKTNEPIPTISWSHPGSTIE